MHAERPGTRIYTGSMPQAVPSAALLPRYLPTLDGLRGVAVLMVILYHATDASSLLHAVEGQEAATPAWLAGWMFLRSGLWCGVDLFFVLSGFLITRILLATRDRPHFFRSFYARRTLRIFPLYYGILAGLFVGLPLAAWLVGGPFSHVLDSENYQQLAQHQWWLWAYLQNFFQAHGPGQLPGMGHFWSLAIEEQFYLVWPAVVLLASRRLGWVCAALSAGVFCLRWNLLSDLSPIDSEPQATAWAVFHWTHTRVDTLVLGALAAVLENSKRHHFLLARYLPYVLLASTLVLLAIGIGTGGWDKLAWCIQATGFTFVGILFGSLVLLLAVLEPRQQKDNRQASLPERLLDSRLLKTIGKFSYAMYLFHWPLCRLAEAMFGERLATNASLSVACSAQFLFVTAASFALAWLSWHLWEKHWLRLKKYVPY